MYASTLSTHGLFSHWLRPVAPQAAPHVERTAGAPTPLGDLFYFLAPGMLGVAVLTILSLVMG